MKHILSTISIVSVLITFVIITGCVDTELEGTFHLSDEARKYQIDTTITSIQFIDNHGISEEFYMDRVYKYPSTHHHDFRKYGPDVDAWFEEYSVAYNSVVNRFNFKVRLYAHVKGTTLEIEWTYTDRLVYNFDTQKIESDVKAAIHFYDTLTVRGITYENIIEIDYTDKVNEITDDTPVRTFISGNKGLIKFIRKDNIILERVR